ncbi:hypothetical protein G6F56_005885 [Rhizopus delemar]|uniref:Uncharacterized protein n=1 Tax=Rhizopus stolonifer TaxID=4846 RepID=A0A367J4J1_RHIST|nr:hypothetical protein G6F56_005885 [Rhizopus delemar]RCH84862.1 hypothetical protein CU098_008999 [Rhizopus stolonifer]
MLGESDGSDEDENRSHSSNTEGAENEEDSKESGDKITEKNLRELADVCGDMNDEDTDGKQLKRPQILMEN